jgi:hypothetical protein
MSWTTTGWTWTQLSQQWLSHISLAQEFIVCQGKMLLL